MSTTPKFDSSSSPLPADQGTPTPAERAPRRPPGRERTTVQSLKCAYCKRTKKACSATADGQFPCTRCTNMGAAWGAAHVALCVPETASPVRTAVAAGSSSPVASGSGTAQDSPDLASSPPVVAAAQDSPAMASSPSMAGPSAPYAASRPAQFATPTLPARGTRAAALRGQRTLAPSPLKGTSSDTVMGGMSVDSNTRMGGMGSQATPISINVIGRYSTAGQAARLGLMRTPTPLGREAPPPIEVPPPPVEVPAPPFPIIAPIHDDDENDAMDLDDQFPLPTHNAAVLPSVPVAPAAYGLQGPSLRAPSMSNWQPSNPEWYSRPPRSTRCKRCLALNEDCSFRFGPYGGFPCDECKAANVPCQDGPVRSPPRDRGRGALSTRQSARARSRSPDRARDRGRPDMNAICGNCLSAGRRCDFQVPCGPCKRYKLGPTCDRYRSKRNYNDDENDDDDDDDEETEDQQMQRAMRLSRAQADSRHTANAVSNRRWNEMQSVRQFGNSLAEASGSAAGADATAGGFSQALIDRAQPSQAPSTFGGGMVTMPDGRPHHSSNLAIQDMTHSRSGPGRGFGGTYEPPPFRAVETVQNDFSGGFTNNPFASPPGLGITFPSGSTPQRTGFSGPNGPQIAIFNPALDMSNFTVPNSIAPYNYRDVVNQSAVGVPEPRTDLLSLAPRAAQTNRLLTQAPAPIQQAQTQTRTEAVGIQSAQAVQQRPAWRISPQLSFNYNINGVQANLGVSAPPAVLLEGYRGYRLPTNMGPDSAFADAVFGQEEFHEPCDEWLNHFDPEGPNFKQPPRCGATPSEYCELVSAHSGFKLACTCKECHAQQNMHFMLRQDNVILNSRGYLCDDCAWKTRAQNVAVRPICTCTSQMRKHWTCHNHREEAIVRFEAASAAATAFVRGIPAALGIPDRHRFCLGCFVNDPDTNSKVWGCAICREWVDIMPPEEEL